eukprot:SM000140S00629  [mRNA]  locus=s140:339575:341158:- [translate_table: standard]
MGGHTVIVATRDVVVSMNAIRWALCSLHQPGDPVTLLHVVSRVPCAGRYGEDAKASEVTTIEVASHIRHLVQPFMHQLKSICNGLHPRPYSRAGPFAMPDVRAPMNVGLSRMYEQCSGKACLCHLGWGSDELLTGDRTVRRAVWTQVDVDLKIAINDCIGEGVVDAVHQLAATRLVMGKATLAMCRPRDFFGRGMRDLATRGVGKEASHIMKHRPIDCSVYVVQRGKLLCQEGPALPHAAESPTWLCMMPSPSPRLVRTVARSLSMGSPASSITPENSPPRSSFGESVRRSLSLETGSAGSLSPPYERARSCDIDACEAEEMTTPLYQALRRTIELRKSITSNPQLFLERYQSV